MSAPFTDPVDALLFDEAGEATSVLVLDDDTGELSTACRDRFSQVSEWNDRFAAHQSMPSLPFTSRHCDDIDLVLLRLPHSLQTLEEYAELIANSCAENVRLVAVGRIKHMTMSMNKVLLRSFADVRASLGRSKCRALHAQGPLPHPLRWPKQSFHHNLGLTIIAHGATFAGTKIDAGTSLLLSTAQHWRQEPGDALDFGSGNGVLACTLARLGHRCTAIDISRFAIASTQATAEANGFHIVAQLADGLGSLPCQSSDLIVTNPPFHIGAAKDSMPTLTMIKEAARVLRPRGEFWCVYNSHLPYLQAARAAFGTDVDIQARNSAFTVIRAVAP